MELQPSTLGLILLFIMTTENNENPLKTKFEKNEKQNDDYYWFGSANSNKE